MKSQIPLLIFTFILIIPGIIPPAQAEMQQAVARSDAIDYLIITNESFVGEFKKLADYRESQGYNVKIETVKNITVHEGRDIPEKIRNYLRDMHQNGLRYVLLGGDYEYVPIRYAYPSAVPNPYTSDPYDMLDVPGLTDFYYSSLSERWDYNNNSIFGEYDDGEGSVKWDPNINYSFDLAVGRAPVHNSMDISIFINKTKAFEQRTGAEIGDVALVGEHVASGGEHGLSDGALELEEYFPEVFPSGYNITRFYQPDCIDVSDATLDVINKDTPYLVVNLGHGGGQLILGNYTSNMIPALEASGSAKPFIWLSGSCLVANLTPTHAQDRNAGEGLVLSPYGPAAFIGNTQFGSMGSEKYSSRILEAVYSQNITTLGEAFLYAKRSIIEDIVSDFTMITPYMTVHTLLGDPALKIARHDFPIPKIVFTYPEENQTLTAGATVEIRWTCENLTENSVMNFGYYDDTFGLTWVKGIDPEIGYYKCKLPDEVSSTYFEAFVVNTSRQRLSSTCISPTFLLDSYPPYISNFDYYYDSGHLFLNITSNELLNTSSLVEGTLIVDGANYSGFGLISAEEVQVGWYSIYGVYLLKSLEPIDERHNCTIYFLSSIKDTSYPGHCLAEPASYYVQGNTSSMGDTSIPQFLGQSAVKDSDSIGFQLILSNDDNVSSVNLVYRNKSTNNWVYILMTKSDNYKCSISCLNNSRIGYFYLIEYDDKMLTIMEDEEKPFEIIFTPSGLIPTEDFNVIDDSIPLTRLPFGFLMAAVGIILIIVACVLAAKDRSKKSHWNQTRKNKK
ncbi:MAG: hypothetical protein KKB04_00875 [Candidatus Thermoplasmatota archaeon]|nr:hypothetical protein [Candidatus Thermoplasmatota archaeon]